MSDAPAYDESQLRYSYNCIITHPTEPRCLLLPREHGWLLPCFEPVDHSQVRPYHINDEMKTQLGLDTIVLRRAHVLVDREVEKRVVGIYVLENRSPSWTLPEGALWAGRTDLAKLELAVPEHREVIQTWLAEDESGVFPTQRAPWA